MIVMGEVTLGKGVMGREGEGVLGNVNWLSCRRFQRQQSRSRNEGKVETSLRIFKLKTHS